MGFVDLAYVRSVFSYTAGSAFGSTERAVLHTCTTALVTYNVMKDLTAI